jgi:hypothetical protein
MLQTWFLIIKRNSQLVPNLGIPYELNYTKKEKYILFVGIALYHM